MRQSINGQLGTGTYSIICIQQKHIVWIQVILREVQNLFHASRYLIRDEEQPRLRWRSLICREDRVWYLQIGSNSKSDQTWKYPVLHIMGPIPALVGMDLPASKKAGIPKIQNIAIQHDDTAHSNMGVNTMLYP